MSGALSKAEERRPWGLSAFPPMVRSFAAAALFPFDDVLRGMVRAGQGIEALCLFLGLTRVLLNGHLARLGLATPHDRPLRKPGAKSWSIMDTIRLIAWRMAGVHPEIIGQRLSRSAGAVRSKARRLGLRPPPRHLLHKPDPNSLRDPEPGFGWRDAAKPATTMTPESGCGRLAGVITWRGRETAVSNAEAAEKASNQNAAGFFRGSIGQGELPLLGVVGGSDTNQKKPAPAKKYRELAELAAVIPGFKVPRTKEEIDLNDDLTWMGKIARPLTHELIVWACGTLMMSGLHYKHVAKRVGMTERAFSTFRTRCSIPVDEDRTKYGHVFDEQIARDTLKESGYKLRQCMTASQCRDGKGNWFWVERNDRGTRLSPPKRKRDYWIEGRYNKITILKGKDARRPLLKIPPPFAKPAGRTISNTTSWSSAYA